MSVPVNDLLKILPELSEYNRDLLYAIARMMLQKQREHPLGFMLAEAPVDDEPTSDEDYKAIRESQQDVAEGRYMTLEQYKKERGL